MTTSSHIKRPTLLFLALTFIFSLLLTAFFPVFIAKTEASTLSHDLLVIDRTRIRMTEARATASDWENAKRNYGDIAEAFDSLEAFNRKIQELFKDKDFIDSNIWDDNENYRFRPQGAHSDCTSVIDDLEPGDTTAHVRLSVPNHKYGQEKDGGGHFMKRCYEFDNGKTGPTVKLDDANKIVMAFAWDDAATIRTYQADNTPEGGFNLFKRDDSNPTRFWRETEEADDPCRDYIDLTATTYGQFYVRKRVSAQAQCVNEPLWSGSAPINIRIGQPEKRSIPAGQGNESQDTDAAALQAPDSCESNNSIVLGWLVCGFLELIDNMIVGLGNAADSLLSIDGSYYDDKPQLK